MVLNDQRRAFSDQYVNLILTVGNEYIEISSRNPIASLPSVTTQELKNLQIKMAKLVVFYSRADENCFGGSYRYISTGNTEKVANMIAEITGAGFHAGQFGRL